MADRLYTDGKHTHIFYAIIASGFFSALGIGFLSFTLPLVSLDAKISGTWLGTGFAGFFLARLFAGPLGGIWADKATPRLPLLVATSFGALIPLLYFAHSELFTLYAIQFVLGVVSGLVRPVGLAILGGSVASEDKGKWFGVHAFMFNATLFLGPLLGGLLYWNRSIESVLIGVSLCMILACGCVLAFVPKGLVIQHHESVGKVLDSSDEKRFVALSLAVCGRTFGIGTMMAFYPIWLSMNLDNGGLLVGALFALPGAVTCLILPFADVLKKRLGGDPVINGMLMSAVGLSGAGLSHHWWQLVIAGCVMGIGAGLSIPESMVQVSILSREQGKGFGSVHFVSGLGFVLGPLVGGYLIGSLHDAGLVLVFAGIVSCFFLFPWAKLKKIGTKSHPQGGQSYSKVLIILCILLIGMCFSWSHLNNMRLEKDGLYRYTEIAMGTVVNLALVADSTKAADNGARKAMALIRELQRDLDFRAPDGSVGRINSGAGKYYVQPTARAYGLIQRSVEYGRMTEGVFDPTIGALTTSPLYYALDETVAQSKKGLVDYRFVLFDVERKRIRLPKQGMALDLGGIAKGTIIDATVKLLRSQGIRAGIVEAGGDFYCFGERDWTVGIRHPRADKIYGTVVVREKAVCGSGDYEQFVNFDEAGETAFRHHIINPADMEPAGKSIGVTVIAGSAERADALATALFIMGPNKGRAFAHEVFPDVAAMWFAPDSAVTVTDNFPQ